MSESLFEAFDPERQYRSAFWPTGGGEWAYRTSCINAAIFADNWPQIKEAIDKGWLKPECRTFDNSHIIDYCLLRGAKKIALELRALDWPEWQRRAA